MKENYFSQLDGYSVNDNTRMGLVCSCVFLFKFKSFDQFNPPKPPQILDIRELKQTDAAAAILQISIQKDSRASEFSRPLTSITLNLNGNLPVDRRRVGLLKLPIYSVVVL